MLVDLDGVERVLIITTDRLRETKLWPGSLLELDYNCGGIRPELLMAELKKREIPTGDETPAEREFLRAIRDVAKLNRLIE